MAQTLTGQRNRYLLNFYAVNFAVTPYVETLTDPTSVIAKMKDPSGTVTDVSASLVHDSVGTYHLDYTYLSGQGDYRLSIQSTGAVASAREILVTVSNTVINP